MDGGDTFTLTDIYLLSAYRSQTKKKKKFVQYYTELTKIGDVTLSQTEFEGNLMHWPHSVEPDRDCYYWKLFEDDEK